MSDSVNPRPYRSELREAHARETRRRVREAADRLFLERGYVDTSMDDIAKAAGVSRQTVFSAFGSKAGVLKEAVDVRLAGDDEPVPIADRPAVRRILTSTDAGDAVRRQAALMVELVGRVAPLWPAMVAASSNDAEIRDLLRIYDEARHEGMGTIVDVVAGLGALRKGRSRAKAKDAVWLLSSPANAYDASTRGWTATDLERWYRDSLVALLLEPGAAGS